MADNGFTKQYDDGSALTESQLDTAYKTLTLDLAQTTQMTTGSTSGHFLKSNGSGVAASFAAVTDPKGPSTARNYSLSATVATGVMTITLKTKSAGTPSTSDIVDVSVPVPSTTSGTYVDREVTSTRTLAINSSATLGITATSTTRIFVYAVDISSNIRLAVSSDGTLDNGDSVTSVAMAASADSLTALYATAATTVTPRMLGWIEAAHDSSGAWQTPTQVSVCNNAYLTDSLNANRIRNSTTKASGTTATQGNFARSNSSSTFETTSTSFVDVTNLSVTITSVGKPIIIQLIPDANTNACFIGLFDNSGGLVEQAFDVECTWQILRDSTVAAYGTFEIDSRTDATGFGALKIPPGSICAVDIPSAGTYAYKLQVKKNISLEDSIKVYYCRLIAYELN